MKKGTILLLMLLHCACTFCQDNEKQQIEIYAIPQLFTAHLSQDSLVPPNARGDVRLGDESTFAFQYGRVFGKHILLKAGIGFCNRQYSMNKYNLDDFFLALFSFGTYHETDSFPIGRIEYRLNYLELPLTIAYEKGGHGAAVQFHYGLNVRLQFLAGGKAVITPSYSSPVIAPADMRQAEKIYTGDARSFVIGIQPYGDLWIRIYKGLSLSVRASLFSLYASPLNKRFSTSQGEFLASGASIAYRF